MNQEVHIVYHLEATADTEADVTIYTTPKGWDFETKEVCVAFPPETDFELEVSFYDGIKKVAPTTGVYVGKGMSFSTDRKIKFEEGSKIILHYKNTNATTVREAVIEIIGTLKSE